MVATALSRPSLLRAYPEFCLGHYCHASSCARASCAEGGRQVDCMHGQNAAGLGRIPQAGRGRLRCGHCGAKLLLHATRKTPPLSNVAATQKSQLLPTSESNLSTVKMLPGNSQCTSRPATVQRSRLACSRHVCERNGADVCARRWANQTRLRAQFRSLAVQELDWARPLPIRRTTYEVIIATGARALALLPSMR